MNTASQALHLVLLTGMSGSGKSVALHALEDMGFYCVDNLPPELLTSLVVLEQNDGSNKLAIAMDVRSARALPLVPKQLQALREQGCLINSIFLDSTTDTLIRRFSETRRRHPLSGTTPSASVHDQRHDLAEAIELERKLLGELREQAHVLDTSMIRPMQLQSYIKHLIASPGQQMTLVFESFAFKRGIPNDADYVFDVRMLPNPHYDIKLRNLTGQDQAVQDFLQIEPDVQRMLNQIHDFLENWLAALEQNHRSYVTVAIGCTGGQHRSVYLVERLTHLFAKKWPTLTRHRELDASV